MRGLATTTNNLPVLNSRWSALPVASIPERAIQKVIPEQVNHVMYVDGQKLDSEALEDEFLNSRRGDDSDDDISRAECGADDSDDDTFLGKRRAR